MYKTVRFKALEKNLDKDRIVVKVAMLGDAMVGKTSLMMKYMKNKYNSAYIETLSVNYMDKTIDFKNANVIISVWDLGAPSRISAQELSSVCNRAKVILFCFDLTQKKSLLSIKTWYKTARKENKVFSLFSV